MVSSMIFQRSVVFGLLFCCVHLLGAHGQEITMNIYGAKKNGTLWTSYSSQDTLTVSCGFGGCIRLKHNETIIQGFNIYTITKLINSVNLSDAGVYTCESYPTTDPADCMDESKTVTNNQSRTLAVIDLRRIHVPLKHFVFLNETLSLVCKSDAYDLTVNKWTTNSTELQSGVITNAKLEDDGNYTCHFSVLGNSNTKTTEVFVLVKPEITSTPIHYNELAIGPDVTNFTVTYKAKSPDNVNITWYHNGIVLEERVVSTHHKMGGSSVIQVYQRAHIGEYRVAIEILFNGYVVSEYNSQGLKTEYKFMVDVKVPPALPGLSLTESTPFEATISINHTNSTADDAPDQITLTLSDSKGDQSDVVTLLGIHSQFTFHNLTPSAEYSVKVAVKNVDGSKEGEAISFITKPTDPSTSSFSVIRTDLQEFNLTLAFNYFGAHEITHIRIDYRPINHNIYKYNSTETSDCINDQTSLLCSTHLHIADQSIAKQRTEFRLEITNSQGLKANTPWTPETIKPLSAPSQASVTFLSEDSVSLVIQLPSSGTPPVLEVLFNFTSTSHSFTHYVRGQFMLEEELTMDIGGDEVSLHSGSRYTVTVRARNFVGWSNFSSGTKFTTYATDTVIVPTSVSSKEGLPIWVIILSGVVPCITVLLIIVATILFVCLIKRFWKKPKGYPITEVTAADKNKLDSSPGESRRIGKFFSFDKPLTPRPPTSEPFDLSSYPPSSSVDDSDSEANLTHCPKYKYVVSPTPNEIGIQGFLGSAPGSGTFVYV